MTGPSAIQLGLYLIVLLVLVKPLGLYMARVYEGKTVGLDRALGWLERLIYRAASVRADGEQSWKAYAVAMLVFNFAGILVVYVLQRLQGQPALGRRLADGGVRTGGVQVANPGTHGHGKSPVREGWSAVAVHWQDSEPGAQTERRALLGR